MSLDRVKVSANFDDEVHKAMGVIADQAGTTMADLIESIVAPIIRQRVHGAIELVEAFRRAGIVGIGRESPADQPPTD